MSRYNDDSGVTQEPPKRPYKVVSEEVAKRAQTHALASLADPEKKTTNLYMDRRELPRGEVIGPRSASLTLEQPTVLVFVDSHPRASFGHDCRYSLYDARGTWLKDVPTQFPPSPLLPTGMLTAFHKAVPTPVAPPPPPVTSPPCPVLPAFGRRYAVLFAGDCQARHVNSIEWCYRTLVGPFGFAEEDVFVYLYDGQK